MSNRKLIILVVDLILIHTVVSRNVHYITPSPVTQCPGESCLALSTLAANSSDYFNSNTTLVFLEGSHTLDSELVVSNINGYLILSTNGSGTEVIICSSEAILEFSEITQLQISGLEFIRCSTKARLVNEFTLKDSRFHGGYNNSALHLTHTNTNIVRSFFVSNRAGTYQRNVEGLAYYVRDNFNDSSYPYPKILSTGARVGGALSVTDSTVNVSSSEFENNLAQVGGAIFSQSGSSITISNCTFVNNSATGFNDDGCHGGALFIDSGCTVTAHNSIFRNNTAGYGGGAIALFQGTFLDIVHNMFSGNRAGGPGGAISAYNRSRITIVNSHYSNNSGRAGGVFATLHYGDISVANSFFNNNRASNSGGVMYAYFSNSITVTNSCFDNNEADSLGGVMLGYSNTNITVGNSSFDSNVAGRHGGVMYAENSSSITVGNSSFYNNEAGYYGGVKFAYFGSSITVNNSSFDNNRADQGGAMLAFSSSSISVGNSSFDNNEADRLGGVIHAYSNSNITVGNSSFDLNAAGIDGGVLCASFSSSITVANSSFDDNEAGNDDGVMYAYSSSNITVSNSSFSNNVAGRNGAVMSAYTNSNITVDFSSFHNNVAGRHGGVMYAEESSCITVGNSSFDNNAASNNGGVMCTYTRCSVTVGNSTFNNNEAGYDGGVKFAYFGSSITVNNSSFDNNRADQGGAMWASSSSSITIGNSSFNNNVAGRNGAVISAYTNSNITVDVSSFHNNVAGRHGGVMYAEESSCITVGNSSFDNNVASNNGGVMCTYTRCSVTVGNSTFNNNEAGYDGGVKFAYFGSSITVNNSSFDNNRADQGGAMWASSSSSITIGNSSFNNNVAGRNGGAMFASSRSSITVASSSYSHNEAYNGGGVLCIYSNTFTMFKNNCTMFNNTAFEGGVVYIYNSSFKELGNMYFDNIANNGGVIVLDKGTVNILASSFLSNIAVNIGGIIYVPDYVSKDDVILAESVFHSNRAASGGVIALQANDNLTVTESTFSYNKAVRGGVICLQLQNKLTIKHSNFSYNSAFSDGGVVYSADQNILTVNNSAFNFNRADNYGGVLCLLFQTKLTVMHVGDNCTFIGCIANFGGAVFAAGSQLVFSNGSCKLVGNLADYGGAIYASESKIVVEMNRWTNINASANIAMHHGGGLYMTRSELNTKGNNFYITENQANNKGGGIHAANSSVIIEGTIHFISNEAENGGAISLERYAKLIGKPDKNDSISLISNSANDYGGALYVDDETNPEMCAAVTVHNVADSSKTECFSKFMFLSFSNNFAGISGINLFGGLLDRCTESNQKNETKKVGLVRFQKSSNITESQLDTISSHPVRLCFCKDSQPDCNYQPEPIHVNRGKGFSLQLITYNHIAKPIRAYVDIDSLGSGTIAGQYINNACTEIVVQFNLFTPVDYENLTLSVIGPCDISGVSKKNVIVKFTCICPIGFQIFINNQTSCDCDCDQVLQSYGKTECNPTTESIIRRDSFWISYIWSNSSGYVIYSHCPLDYCHSPDKSVSINLNLPNGSDAQCDSNRTGTLCGTCKPGLSVSLGSSRCIPCTAYWPGLLVTVIIVFLMSGIGLVVILLVMNLTVAIGTLNAVIFYVNIVTANKSALFPSGVSPASVFISWLNFDFGFDICFFDGINTYIKTWLQLAFPAYIIFLVVVITRLSYCFDAFGRLAGKKDPVATLATLILLSYSKLLQTIITVFSSATLVYPDGSKKTLWLPDATQEYFSSKHAVLFFTAVIILLAGLVYTFLLFSWQWFLKCPRKRALLWIRNQKLSSFIETYLVPHTPNHRYWTGLLLLVRVSVYLVSAFNPSGDPRVTLAATTFIMTSLVIYVATFGVKMYKNWFINTIEILTYFNIIALSIFTWYTLDADTNQMAITNMSVGIIFVQLTAVIIYHAYKYMNQKLFATIQGSMICIKVKEIMAQKQQERFNHTLVSADENILLDMIDRPTNINCNVSQAQSLNPSEPTQSVVELPESQQSRATPPPLEVTKEEAKFESEQQASEEDDVYVIKNLSEEIDMNEQCNMDQSSQKVLPVTTDNGQQERDGSHCVIVKPGLHGDVLN